MTSILRSRAPAAPVGAWTGQAVRHTDHPHTAYDSALTVRPEGAS